MAHKLGTVNGYVLSTAWFRGVRLTFNGTTKDLAEILAGRGARVGEKVLANYGGTKKTGAREHSVVADGRPCGIWVA